MPTTLYAVPGALITALLLALVLAGIELGHRLGRSRAGRSTEASRQHVNGLQSALLGLLALLLAFTFSLALQRFDSRSEAVVREANAIGTAFLRADLLPSAARDEARRAMADYVDLRVREADLALADAAARSAVNAQALQLQGAIWRAGVAASRSDGGSMSTLLYLQAVNDLIDSFGSRGAALDRHVPELVNTLLLATFVLSAGITGYAAGLAGHRPSWAAHLLVGLMAVLVFVALDLDRPRRGVIQVSHASLLDLQTGVRQELRATPAR